MNALSGSIHQAINQAQHRAEAEGEEAPADKSIYQIFNDVLIHLSSVYFIDDLNMPKKDTSYT